MNIFEQIIASNSMIHIDLLLEQALATATEDTPTVRKIYESNDLDERWLLAHEQLGNHDKAQVLRQWLELKHDRRV